MKIANLFLFFIVAIASMFANWLVFQQFPWMNFPVEQLENILKSVNLDDAGIDYILGKEYQEGIVTGLRFLQNGQYVLVYILGAAASFSVLLFGEKKIFTRQAKINWSVLLPLWVLPIMSLGSPIAYGESDWFSFLLISNWVAIVCLAMYSGYYQAYPSKRGAVTN